VKVLGVIPARIGATRFPGKPLALLHGRAIVLHVLDRARECDALDRIVVATDSPEIARIVTADGGEAMSTRADHPSGTDRAAEVSARLPDYGAVVPMSALRSTTRAPQLACHVRSRSRCLSKTRVVGSNGALEG